MARRCFEVSSLTFDFGELKLPIEVNAVFEKISKKLKKYASNTGVRDHFSFSVSGRTVLHVEFHKKISVNTINNILNQIFAESNKIFKTIYDGRYNEFKVTLIKLK